MILNPTWASRAPNKKSKSQQSTINLNADWNKKKKRVSNEKKGFIRDPLFNRSNPSHGEAKQMT